MLPYTGLKLLFTARCTHVQNIRYGILVMATYQLWQHISYGNILVMARAVSPTNTTSRARVGACKCYGMVMAHVYGPYIHMPKLTCAWTCACTCPCADMPMHMSVHMFEHVRRLNRRRKCNPILEVHTPMHMRTNVRMYGYTQANARCYTDACTCLHNCHVPKYQLWQHNSYGHILVMSADVRTTVTHPHTSYGNILVMATYQLCLHMSAQLSAQMQRMYLRRVQS